jgi:uncharacterized C2H2 Zn-finger protein
MTSISAPSFNRPTRRTFFVADLKCYLCGSVRGSIESEHALAGGAGGRQPVKLTRPGETSAVEVLDWTHLRCDRCGGPLFLDDSDVITRRVDEDYNWLDERPRRGRPPKRLLEERRLERELLELEADPRAA